MNSLADRAQRVGRDYITSEDVQDCIDEGIPKLVLWDELLAILGKQRGIGVEDW